MSEKVLKEYLGSVEDKLDAEGTFVVAISTEDKDRSDEVLRANGFELGNYRKNPVVLWAHNYSEPPIAKALWVKVVANKLKAKLKFAQTQFAQEIKMLYEEGFLKAWSVGFMPKKWKDGEDGEDVRREYTKVELLEFSAVPVPCNPMALNDAIKMVKDVKLKEILEKEVKEQKPEETDDTVRIPVEGEEGKHEDHKIRTITISKKQGIKALYCVDCKKVITYLFDKSCKNAPDKCDWTMEDAKEWMKEHSGKVNDVVIDRIKETIDNMSEEDWKALEESIEIYLETGEIEKAKYKCSCIDCGWETETDEHCKNIKCDKCGGTMRRADRPGPGEETDDDKGKVKCQGCGALIDYKKEPEVMAGAIKCPECKLIIDQEGVVLPDGSKNLVTVSDTLLEFEKGEIDIKETLSRIEKAMTNVIEKVGAVLSKRNKAKLVVAKENIQNILDAAEVSTGDDDGKVISNEDIIEAIKALKETKKEVEKKESKPSKEKDTKKEVSDAEVQNVKTVIKATVGEYLDKHIREIRLSVLGKIQ